MNTANSISVPVLPPGTIVPCLPVDPAIPSVQITFKKPRPATPLPPLVQASFDGTHLNVSAILFIDSAAPNPIANITVRQVYCIDNEGNPQLQFYLSYDCVPKPSATFNSYNVDFQAHKAEGAYDIPLSEIKTITVFNWDSDPVTSRGTETTVQP